MAGYFHYPVMLFKQLFFIKKEKTLNFPQIGWTLLIPKKFELLSDKKIKELNEKGAELLEKIYGEQVNNPANKHLFMAKSETGGAISCGITNLDEQTGTEWEMYNDRCYNAFLKMVELRYKNFTRVTITTESSLRQKGSIVFKTLDIISATPTRELNRARFYDTIYKNHGINISMVFTDGKIGEEMLDILRNSTFE